jgi:glyoxylase-like metal-dependent hydrolase (beta-lactamase superfamily II)
MGSQAQRVVGRRWVLAQAGRGVLGFAVLGIAACAGSDGGGAATTPTGASPPDDSPPPGDEPASVPLTWSRVDLGFVAAYVLVRGDEAAVVDTGVGGSAAAIGAVLADAGPGWAGVRHVVLTHRHPDHVGSLGDVLAEAPGAAGYAGEADLAAVPSPRPLSPVTDGDEVFGLRIVATPGHTAGHVAVFDAGTGVLVAGDALTNEGQLTGSNPRFTEDAAAAAASVRALAALQPRTILVGHGPPVTEDASTVLDRLAASL